ncbi:hypothetical protein [Poriferisphaera sp. WC338]|uniref:hypothetical protein n=1 Tax=Poriferisphaera sp. WC338 TaxID=3425129 RepID=UPI003D817E9E
MLLISYLLAFTGFLATVLGLSLMTSSWRHLLVCFTTALVVFVAYPYIISVNFQNLIKAAAAPDSMALLSLCLIVEGLFLLWTCHKLTTQDADRRPEGTWPGQGFAACLRCRGGRSLGVVVYIPALTMIVALLVLQSWLFHEVSGVSFRLITVLLAVSIFLLLLVLSAGARWLLPQRDGRIETRMQLGMLQIGLAMFVPIIASRTRAIGDPYAVELAPTLLALSGMAVVAVLGYGAWTIHHRIRQSKGLWL